MCFNQHLKIVNNKCTICSCLLRFVTVAQFWGGNILNVLFELKHILCVTCFLNDLLLLSLSFKRMSLWICDKSYKEFLCHKHLRQIFEKLTPGRKGKIEQLP